MGTSTSGVGSQTAFTWMAARRSALLAAVAVTLLNAVKPIVVDDVITVEYARSFAERPADPYGFEVFFSQKPTAATALRVPPGLPAWLAPAVALAPDSPAAWKLWLFPFALALTLAMNALASRFAPGVEAPLVWLVAFSPAVLSSFSLGPAVPALGLSLAALALFAKACDGQSGRTAAMAAALAALAMQTEYAAAVSLLAIAAYAALSGQLRLGLLATLIALSLFGAWELLTVLRYNASLVLHGVDLYTARYGREPTLVWLTGLVAILGAAAPAVGALGLVALGRKLSAALAALLFAGALLAIPFIPGHRAAVPHFDRFTELQVLEGPVLILIGGAVLAICLAVCIRLVRSGTSEGHRPGRSWADAFLLTWLALELAGFFLVSPFLAQRRAAGIVVVLALLSGRLAARASRDRGWLRFAAGFGVSLGLLGLACDAVDGWVRRDAVSKVMERIELLGRDPARESIWYTGHWGFQFYGEQAGMKPAIAGRSDLRRGDWLVVPVGVDKQELLLHSSSVRRVAEVVANSPSPWSTIPLSYIRPTAVRKQPEAQMRVSIYRVVGEHKPAGLIRSPR